MKTSRYVLSQLLFALFLFVLFSSSVQAETMNCTVITSLPYSINAQGIYCLASDLSTGMTSGNAIEIATNNVVIDLNGHKLGGLAAGLGTHAAGIYAYQRQNITIKNGTVRGFYRGIWLDDDLPYTTSQGHIVEDIRADQNTFVGLTVEGRANTIRNNIVVDTGRSTDVAGSAGGIVAVGPIALVVNNSVRETKEKDAANAYSWGVYIYTGEGSVVADNTIGNISFTNGGTSYGIYITNSSDVTVKGNIISNMKYAINYDVTATGIYMNNLTSGCLVPFTGGTAAGSTNYHLP